MIPFSRTKIGVGDQADVFTLPCESDLGFNKERNLGAKNLPFRGQGSFPSSLDPIEVALNSTPRRVALESAPGGKRGFHMG